MASHPNALDVVAGLDWSDKRVVVTGANAGIGVETARAFAATGAEVHMACRTHDTATAARADILRTHPKARVELLALDLADLRSVERCAELLGDAPLDRLICNAGVYGGPFSLTAQGFERTVGVSHFGHLLLFDRLRPAMLQARESRLVMVSSESHRTPRRLNFDAFPLQASNYRDIVAYGQAKLCNALMAAQVQRRWGAQGLEAASLHPGTLMATSIGRSSPLARLALRLWRPFAKTLAQGAATSLHCAVTPSLEGGGYYSECAPKRASAEARSEAVAAKLWARSSSLLNDAGFALRDDS